MDIRKVRKLIELVEETGIAEIEIKEGEESVRICRSFPNSGNSHPVYHTAPPQYHSMPEAKPAAALHRDAKKEDDMPDGHVVTSPMVGTFYASSAPGEAPFVTIGQRVEVGDTLCIIEAMKMMNQIESDKAGILIARLAENGQPVEFEQPLFVIED
jgi:acetyl-CoA carboxylase biotin carboxyl carrier protein